MRKPIMLSILVAASGLLLMGCSDYSILDREQKVTDALPKALDVTDISQGSSRLAAQDGDQSFWLAHGETKNQICLIVYESENAWIAACGSGRVETSGTLGSFIVQPDGQLAPADSVEISENIFRKS